MDENIILIDENGKKKEYRIILTFEIEENDDLYIVYTDDSVDKEGFIKTYAGIYQSDNPEKLLPIENDEEWEVIEHLLDNLDKDENNNEK